MILGGNKEVVSVFNVGGVHCGSIRAGFNISFNSMLMKNFILQCFIAIKQFSTSATTCISLINVGKQSQQWGNRGSMP